MKRFITIVFFLVSVGLAFAGYAANGKGLHYRLVKKNEHQIHLLDIDPQYFDIVIARAKSDKQLDTVSALAKHYHAKAGINGGYFDISSHGDRYPVGALKINGEWIHAPHPARAAIGWSPSKDVVLIDRIESDFIPTPVNSGANLLTIFPSIRKLSANEESWQEVDNIVGGVPLLIKNGEPIKDFSVEKARESFLYERHARTAVCIKNNKHWLFAVISHTKTPDRKFTRHVAEGFTIPELVSFLHKQGCLNAINLDGGGSSTLVIDNRIVNWPAGDWNEHSHLYEERKVSEAILLIPKN